MSLGVFNAVPYNVEEYNSPATPAAPVVEITPAREGASSGGAGVILKRRILLRPRPSLTGAFADLRLRWRVPVAGRSRALSWTQGAMLLTLPVAGQTRAAHATALVLRWMPGEAERRDEEELLAILA